MMHLANKRIRSNRKLQITLPLLNNSITHFMKISCKPALMRSYLRQCVRLFYLFLNSLVLFVCSFKILYPLHYLGTEINQINDLLTHFSFCGCKSECNFFLLIMFQIIFKQKYSINSLLYRHTALCIHLSLLLPLPQRRQRKLLYIS